MGNKFGPIVFIDGTVNKDVYIAVLVENLLPFVDALNADGVRDIKFQQDNARPHVCSKTMKFLEDAVKEHGFTVMNWPAIPPQHESNREPLGTPQSSTSSTIPRYYVPPWIA